ncbi:Arylacetonitrilase [Pseudocercospora fuligena]|uniref:nitrilase n=1 Tax=Pseudocercospora fuligena TaxID=685502 RepID=A0A8H6VIL2_9PEZI|nr:Arylacetonitrilase [Pseudocercospora fuligena]
MMAGLLLTTALFATAAIAAPSNGSAGANNLYVALVRSAPANWPQPFWNKNWTNVHFDINATVDQAVDLITEAAHPERRSYYPKGIDEAWIETHAQDYFDNSLEVGDQNWEKLISAAKDNHIFTALAFSHKQSSSIYMGQALLSPQGEIFIFRHKLRPSGIERSFWSDGDTHGLQVVETPLGRTGLLECWEHFHPSMTFNMQAQLESLHIASFPYMPNANDPNALYWESLEVNSAAARLYAVNSGAVTLFTSVGYAAVYSGEGLTIAEISADAEEPMLYAEIDTSGFDKNVTYDVDGEQSWGTLQQIVGSWPDYIPKVNGSFVERKVITLEEIFG